MIPVPAAIGNILIVKLRTLGDILTTFPLLRALKELYPQARITMVADDLYQEILETNPRIDDLWLHPAGKLRQRGGWFAFTQQLAMLKKIRDARFDLYLDLYGSMRTAVWGAAGSIPVRLGFALRGRKYFYTHPIESHSRYVVDLNLQFAQILGWSGKNQALEFYVTADDQFNADADLKKQGWDSKRPLLAVSPGGGWALKQWGAERFARVIRALVKITQCQVVLSGSVAEAGLVAACAEAIGTPCFQAVGLPLRQVAAVIKRSRLFLGNDSGPKYFAEAFGVPTLIFYGPTDFVNNNPDTPKHRVQFKAMACRPCHSENCRLSKRDCMDGILEEDAIHTALVLWQAGA